MDEPKKYYLLASKIFFSTEEYEITTILGSCVSVCLWDSKLKFGGMTHYLLPKCKVNCKSDMTYGNTAIPMLLDLMLKNNSSLQNIKARIYGGAQMFNTYLETSIGEQNINIALKILNELKIDIIDKDTGDKFGRKIIFNNVKNFLTLKKLNTLS